MLFNTNYKPVRPPDYQSKFKIPYQKQTDFYNVEVYNDSFYLLEKQITSDKNNLTQAIQNLQNKTVANEKKIDGIELTDEKIKVVAEDKKLSEVLPTVARKGEIESLTSKTSSLTNLIKDYKVAMDGYFSDLGTEVNRHANANNKLEELL